MSTMEQQVKRIIGRAAMVPAETLAPDTRLADLGIDSLDQIECVLAVEEAFQLELADTELWQLRTVQDVVDAVRQAAAAASRAAS